MSRPFYRFSAVILLVSAAAGGGPRLDLANVQAPPPSVPDEPLARTFSLARAAQSLDTTALHWQKTRQCAACHTLPTYLMARPFLAAVSPEPPEVRRFFETIVAERLEAKPALPKDAVAAVVVEVAAALAFHDRFTTGKLHPRSRQELDRMWTLQRQDGSWEWPFRDTPPLKSDEHFGVTLAAIGAGVAPENYAHSAAARQGLAGIRRFLKAQPATSLHQKAMVLWASKHVLDLLTPKEEEQILAELRAAQRPDGGWSMASLVDNQYDPLRQTAAGRQARREKGHGQEFLVYVGRDKVYRSSLASDGYATGLVVYVLRQAGMAAGDPRLRRGVEWLKANQRESGRWFTPSQAWHTQHRIANAGSAFAILALHACGEIPGRPLEISVDATDAPRKLYRARLVIPAAPGPLTLYYPKWIQGEHQPSGPIIDLSGVKLSAAGKPLTWRRDDVDLYAFHCTVPEGASAVEASLDYLIPGDKGGFGAGPATTARLAIINWYLVTLYPKGRAVRDIPVRASLTLPKGWQAGTALPVESQSGNVTQFKTVPLETFADSPALCGQHFREIPLGTSDGPPHFLVLACDSAAGLAMSDRLKGHYERLVLEAGALFGARHYRSYRFLVALSDQFGHNAIEHHECSDNRMPERMMIDDQYRKLAPAWVLPHEYVHSWNGKYRRPAGLATPDFQEPMRTRLLWVYEGLTEYLGYVLAVRSGLYTPEASRDNLAAIADWAKNQGGRTWRPLEDTTAAAPHLYSARGEWSSRRRGVDFYDEGALIWLDADTLIREKTGGKKSLDDFCRGFFGGKGGAPEVRPYDFEDIVAALNGVVVHDWKGFLDRRLTSTDAQPPLDGLARGGWKLVYSKDRSDLQKTHENEYKQLNLTSSIGLLLKDDGKVIDVVPGTAADGAGLGPHMKVLAVNGRRFTAERLREAIAATRDGKTKLRLLTENGDYFQTYTLNYAGGERYPHLERDAARPDLIGAILRPRVGK